MIRPVLHLISLSLLLLSAVASEAAPLPPSRNVHIEVRHPFGSSRLMYFWQTDLYTKVERKVKSEFGGDGVAILDFTLYHPLYDEIIVGSNLRVPFYAEPGDSLVIQIDKSGKVERYSRKDGTPLPYENLLRHDVSNNLFYTHEDFSVDKQQNQFPDFVASVTRKMNVALDSVSRVADRYHFSPEERNLARCNVQMQFAIWIYEYAPYKESELLAYARQHEGGWQSLPEQDAEIEAIRDVRNYGFMCDLPLEDTTVFASKYFPPFIQSYEHTLVLNQDQYLYYDATYDNTSRMDSAYVAQELNITHLSHPSLFMDVAMQRRHVEKPQAVNDGSIQLQEVQVVGSNNLDQFYRVFGPPKEYDPKEVVEKAWAHDVNLIGDISSLLNRKKIKNYKRAKKLIERIAGDDAEREALMKAYEAIKSQSK